MWAATQVLDLLCFPQWVQHPAGVAVFVAALAVLARPSAFGRVLLMCGSNLVYLYVQSPTTPNHILFEGFVNLAILLVALRHRRRTLGDLGPTVFHEALPYLRGLLVSLYAFAFLHKLNWDFISPATSCAGFMLDGIFGRFELAPPGGPVKPIVPWLALMAEGSIPLLLLFPRTRRLAMLVAWPFHFGLAFHPRPGIYGFSSMLLAMLTLFLPPGFYTALLQRPLVARMVAAATAKRAYWTRLLAGLAVVAVLIAFSIVVSGTLVENTRAAQWVRRAGMLLWMPYATVLLAGLLIGWRGARGAALSSEAARARLSPAVVALLLFFFNGMAAYLGFQTVRTMSMFSNIRTEGDRTNHLFIPSSLQVADYQDDLVRLIDSSDPWLAFYARNQSLLPFTELRRRVWENPAIPVQVTYERAGTVEALDTARPGAAQRVPPLPFPLHKILAFREVDQDGREIRCLW
jgi:hypothetical protein